MDCSAFQYVPMSELYGLICFVCAHACALWTVLCFSMRPRLYCMDCSVFQYVTMPVQYGLFCVSVCAHACTVWSVLVHGGHIAQWCTGKVEQSTTM